MVVGGSTGSLKVIDVVEQKVIFKEKNPVTSEITHLFCRQIGEKHTQVLALNADQNLLTYDVHKSKNGVKLVKTASRCLFLDEVIDLKFISKDFALLCTNSETLKLLHLGSG